MSVQSHLPEALAVRLHGQRVGILNRLANDRYLFAFTDDYIEDRGRPTLSLSFKDAFGGLIADVRSASGRLPAFFSNLLPEGALRDYLAAKAGVRPGREFALLSLLGPDLPGALTVEPVTGGSFSDPESDERVAAQQPRPGLLKFSLAGVQLKFSALVDGAGHLTIPADGIGGSWIVKLPSTHVPAIAENEFAMMKLARRVGIDVPEVRLVAVEDIGGLPDGIKRLKGQALAVRRFDRAPGGFRVHMEDFAQVFGIHPNKKYEGRSYADIATVLSAETGDIGIREYMRRLVFAAVTGNGDMHLKNWSLLYPDTRTPVLAPAYDFVATIPYSPDDRLALTLGGRRNLRNIGRDQIRRFAERSNLAVNPLWEIVEDTSSRIVEAWRNHGPKDLLPADVRDAIDRQINRAA